MGSQCPARANPSYSSLYEVPDCCVLVLGLLLSHPALGCNVPRQIWMHPRLYWVPTGDADINGVTSFSV